MRGNRKKISITLNGKEYSLILRKERGVKKEYLTLTLPKSLDIQAIHFGQNTVEIIPRR